MKEIAVAKVGKSFGTRGELTMTIYDTLPADFNREEPLFVRIDNLVVPLFLDSFERRGQRGAVVAFADFDTTFRAAELIGKELFIYYDNAAVHRGGREEGEDDEEIYLEDLVGYTALFEGSELRGEIIDFIDDDFNPLFTILIDGNEALIPAADDLIVEFDTDEHTILFALPEGLLELYIQ